MGLTHRARVRRFIERAAQRASMLATADGQPAEQGAPATEPEPDPEPVPEPESPDEPTARARTQASDFARDFQPGALARERETVTSLLYERLSAEEVAEVEHRIAGVPELSHYYASASTPAFRQALLLTYGVWLGVASVSEKTGLSQEHPSEQVHAMARGPLAAAGGLYEADLVADALASAGAELSAMKTALDFGCSSGRVVRVFAAAYPEINWHGCDPNRPAITWASDSLAGIDFFANDDVPPLPLADRSLDLVYAISIWSHFKPALGLRWFEEMHRLIPPGGYLVCTTHGLASVAIFATRGLRTPEQSQEIEEALYDKGWWYAPEFGEQGDWGS